MRYRFLCRTAVLIVLLILRFLEGRADRILGAGRKAGAYRNRACIAVAFTIVVYTIVNVAMDTLNVLLTTTGRAILLIVHSDDLLFSRVLDQ